MLGSGPFKFVRHEAGSRWVGERFADYFEKDRPYLDGFEAIFITNTAASVNALTAARCWRNSAACARPTATEW